MTEALAITILGYFFVAAGVFCFGFGGWCLLLTSGGDRGGDSGVHEIGCVGMIAAVLCVGAATLLIGGL